MTASDLSTAYIDTRDLEPRKDACPFRGCAARLETAPYRRKLLPYCPIHAIRIHANGFVYYYGSDTSSKRKAAMRNIRFERDFFDSRILGKSGKAESGRFCNENSEDAVTWNVFSRQSANCLEAFGI